MKIFFASILAATCLLCNADNISSKLIYKKYHGIRPDDKNGRVGILNPERGFRWVNRFGSFNNAYADEKWLAQIKTCADDGITMTQAYCELLDYCEMDKIPEEKIRRIQESFDAVRKAGIKLLLCFRYERSSSDRKGPTAKIILSHIKQLKPLLRKNMDVIAVFQTGFVGLYGEWHRSFHKIDKDQDAQKRIILALLNMLPPERKMVIRYPYHKTIFIKNIGRGEYWQPMKLRDAHSLKPEARIGICDHGFMVGESDAGTFPKPPSEQYSYMTYESLFVPMEGELFWVHSNPYGRAKDDGLVAAKRLWEHHYSTFSYAHNHSRYEGWKWKEKFGARYSIDEWKEDEITKEFLLKNHMPVSDGYFENKKGNYVKRSVFDYIRDHFGYRLELRSSCFPSSIESGKTFSVKIKLVNRGFAAPINPRPVYLVLVSDNKVYKLAKAKTDVRKWYPCDPLKRTKISPEYSINFENKRLKKIPSGKYKLGLWMPDFYKSIRKDSRYSIRLANRNVPWWTGRGNEYGINIIGGLEVK